MATETITLQRLDKLDGDLVQSQSPYAQTPGLSLPESPRSASPPTATAAEMGGGPDDREVTPLAPADRGKDAWAFLIAATVIETTVWGLLNAVGILQQYWSTKQFPGNDSTVTLATSLMNGLSFMGAGAFGPVFAAAPHYTKSIQWFALVVSTAGLVGSAFVTSPSQLIGTVGILYPFAAGMYLPAATMIYEWFNERRGLASGIMFAGTGVGGTLFPFLLDGLLRRFGYKPTMIALGLGFAVVNGVSLMYIRRRIPLPPANVYRRPKVHWQHLASWAFVCGFSVMLLTSLGNFNPTLWIPTFTDVVGAHRPGGVALVAIMNAASVPGNAIVGYLSDRIPTKVMISVTMILAALAVLLPWGLGTTTAPLVIFSILWGMTALSFPGLWSKVITPICKDDTTLPMLVFSIFATLRGVGSVTAGPISNKLIQTDSFRGAAGAYGTNFGAVLVYTAVTVGLGGIMGMLFPA